jgi:hypothetical protein
VTPEGVRVDWTWGVDRPTAGILARTVADVGQVETYDPDRVLDPGNAASPWAPYIAPDTPIRLSHRGSVIRTGLIESVAYGHDQQVGRIRITSDIGKAKRAMVPSGSALGSTLYEVASDALAAAGLQYPIVGTPSGLLGGGGDPTVTTPDTTDEQSAWDHIERAAQEVLYVPWVDRNRILTFRPYGEPFPRARTIPDTILVDLVAEIDDDDLYSVVRALDDDGVTVEEAVLSPTPAYGLRVYERTDKTIDADAWVVDVLADRGERRVRYRPGMIFPTTAAWVDWLAAIEPVDLIGIDAVGVVTDGIVLQQRVKVRCLRLERHVWQFYISLTELP